MAAVPLVGPSYLLDSRPASVQRAINLMPVPIEPGNERAGWTLKDAPGLIEYLAADAVELQTLPIWLWLRGDVVGGNQAQIFDFSTNHRTVVSHGAAANSAAHAYETAGCIALLANADYLTTDPLPLFDGRWDIRFAVHVPTLAAAGSGAHQVLFQGADYSASNSEARDALSIVVSHSAGAIGITANGYANSNGNYWTISDSYTPAGVWAFVRVTRTATHVTLYGNGQQLEQTAMIDGTGGPSYITPLLRGGLVIGRNGPTGTTYANSFFDELYIDNEYLT